MIFRDSFQLKFFYDSIYIQVISESVFEKAETNGKQYDIIMNIFSKHYAYGKIS